MGCREKMLAAHRRVVAGLLDIAAPDLKTLCVFGHGLTSSALQSAYWPMRPALHTKVFPCLRELSLAGFVPAFEPVGLLWLSTSAVFPALVRLHISVRAQESVELRKWVVAAPELRDLRVTLGFDSELPRSMCEFFWSLGKLPDHLKNMKVLNLRAVSLDQLGTRNLPSKPLVKIAALPQSGSFPCSASRQRATQAREEILSKIEEHVRSSQVRAVLVTDYFMQDAPNLERARAWRREWEMSGSLDALMRADWMGRVESKESELSDQFWLDSPGACSMFGDCDVKELSERKIETIVLKNF